jgi:hypothetical protein
MCVCVGGGGVICPPEGLCQHLVGLSGLHTCHTCPLSLLSVIPSPRPPRGPAPPPPPPPPRGDVLPSPKDLIDTVRDIVKDLGLTLVIEPGRSMVANSSALVNTVTGGRGGGGLTRRWPNPGGASGSSSCCVPCDSAAGTWRLLCRAALFGPLPLHWPLTRASCYCAAPPSPLPPHPHPPPFPPTHPPTHLPTQA